LLHPGHHDGQPERIAYGTGETRKRRIEETKNRGDEESRNRGGLWAWIDSRTHRVACSPATRSALCHQPTTLSYSAPPARPARRLRTTRCSRTEPIERASRRREAAIRCAEN